MSNEYRLVKKIALRLPFDSTQGASQGSSALFQALNMMAERSRSHFFH
jgi:hypothetical protein